VCLAAGTYALSSSFYVSRSGTAGHPIVYRAYGGTALLKWTGGSSPVVQAGSAAHDVEFHSLVIDGAGRATSGFKCDSGAHHLIIRESTIKNTGSAGVMAKSCDYVTVLRNLISHTGYNPNSGWSSAVSLNGNRWSDRAGGFHDFVVGNVISGASDEAPMHSEGHGVIVDRAGNGPAVLIANNVVYENGGRCLDAYLSAHVWFVNNTCYKNGLDKRHQAHLGEICGKGWSSTDLHFVNNVAYAWTNRGPYKLVDSASGTFSHNVAYGGIESDVPSSVSIDPLRLRLVDPLFTNQPVVSATLDQQQRTAVVPWKIGNAFVPRIASPLIGAGVDPRTVSGLTTALRAGITRYLLTDVRGAARPKGRWDVGAYEQ